jgi:lipid A ethanolaminephosphotransferase
MDNIQDCSRQSIVNAYDNTILYTDHILSRVIDLLQAQRSATAMLYVSDHGESLGENGLYLHGLPYALAPVEQKQVPMIFWASEKLVRQKSLDIAALEARRQTPYSHDFIFHSVLGLFGVGSEIYRPELDIFADAARIKSPEASEGIFGSQEI